MRRAVLLTLLLFPSSLAASASTRPAAQPVTVLGTTQLDGQNARTGQTFTIGVQSPLNFTLTSAEYSTGRVIIGRQVIVPAAAEKLLVLHYTVQNPQKKELRYYWADVRFTAVDAQDRTHDFVQAVTREGTAESLSVTLKPAEKVAVMTVIRVPAAGPVPKLIVQRDGDARVLRYDLHGQVRPLAAAAADPADPSGATALGVAPAVAGQALPLGSFDVRLDSATFTTAPLNGKAPAAGRRYLSAVFTLRNPLQDGERYAWSSFTPSLKDQDGEQTAYNQVMLKASRDEASSGELGSGEEVRVRYFFELPQDVLADTLTLKDASGRGYRFDLRATR